jgi:DNA (cytosine-5)-methyltransferase 1
MTHLDLFSGIGGFAYAADQVFGDVTHIFCDTEPFARKILNKHWPESEIFEDVRTITNTNLQRRLGGKPEIDTAERHKAQPELGGGVDVVTGGFPCQPFSHAGARRGTADDRYLWPEMLRIIRLAQPAWVIAENVGGLVTWNDGLVLETVCTDLEASGYEVQPFIIPAAAVGAPHRRDRIWFIAHTLDERKQRSFREKMERLPKLQRQSERGAEGWADGWPVSKPRTVGVDDGIPDRTHRIKSLGNAIVPQVAVQIMKSIKEGAL